jgi:hypothetical protein
MTFVGVSVISLLAFPILLRALIASRQPEPFTLQPRELAFPLCASAFVSLAATGVGFLDRHGDRAVSYDGARDEVTLAERCCGRTISQRRYARADVATVHVHWRATLSGSTTIPSSGPGWWVAQLVLADGQAVHLHAIVGGPEAPPAQWLSRFRRASELVGKPLQVSSLPLGAEIESGDGHPVQHVVSKVGQQRLHTRSIALLVKLAIGLIVVVIYAGSRLIR